MLDRPLDTLIEPTESLQGFFKERIESAVEKHSINSDEDALWYLTQLLCNYSKTSAFLDNTGSRAALTPLADYYRALSRKPVGVDYYMSMGEAAYSTLADESAQTSREKTLQHIFETLANDFSNYVVALSEVPVKPDQPRNLTALVDEWHAEKHPAVARELKSRGVILFDEYTSGQAVRH